MTLPIMEVDAVTEKDLEIQELRRQRDFLLQEIDELREKQRWIPVEERLPEDLELLLISAPYERHPERPPSREIGLYDAKYDRWVTNSAFNLRPSHWMPLPEPPGVRE